MKMAIKTTIGIILFILSMSLFITAYKICNDEDKEMNSYYLFISLILSIGIGSLSFIFVES